MSKAQSPPVRAVRAADAPPGCYLSVEGGEVWPVVLFEDEDGLIRADCPCTNDDHCLHTIAARAEYVREYVQD